MVKVYFAGRNDWSTSVLLQCRGLRVLVDCVAPPLLVDAASLDLVLLCCPLALSHLPALLVDPALRCPVLALLPASLLLSLPHPRVTRMQPGERFVPPLAPHLAATPLPSGLALGAANWRLECHGRTIALLGPSSLPLQPPRPLPALDPQRLLGGCDALVVLAVPRPPSDFICARAEVRALLAATVPPGSSASTSGSAALAPVVMPLSAPLATGPAFLDIWDCAPAPPAPSLSLCAVDAAAVMAALGALPEHLRVPSAAAPQPMALPSLPVPRASHASQTFAPLYAVAAPLFPSLLAALPSTPPPVILSVDPSAPALPQSQLSVRRVPLDPSLTPLQLRSLASMVPAVALPSPGGPFPLRLRPLPPSSLATSLPLASLPPTNAARVVADPGALVLEPPRSRAPSAAAVVTALRDAGFPLVRVAAGPAEGHCVLTLPTLGGARIVLTPDATRLLAPNVECHRRLAAALSPLLS